MQETTEFLYFTVSLVCGMLVSEVGLMLKLEVRIAYFVHYLRNARFRLLMGGVCGARDFCFGCFVGRISGILRL